MNQLSLHHHIYEPAPQSGAPTILALHGTGGDERDLVPLARAIAPDANVLSPRGNISEHGAPRFFRRMAEGVFDLKDLHQRTADLASWLDAAATHYGFDRKRVIALGFSNGANIAASLLLSGHTLAGAMLIRPMVPFSPAKAPTPLGTPVLQLNGRLDPIVPTDNAETLAALLRNNGADVQAHMLPASHGLVQDDLDLAQKWWQSAFAAEVSR